MGKSAVLEKVVEMMISERTEERKIRNERSRDRPIIGGMRTEPILEDGVRVGFECVDIITGDRAVIAHKNIDSGKQSLEWESTPRDSTRSPSPRSSERSSHARCWSSTRSGNSPLNLRPLSRQFALLWNSTCQPS